MALFKLYTAPLLGIWKIEESFEELFAQLANKEEYLPFLNTVKAERRKIEWVTTRVLLKQMLGKEVRIAYHPNGMPYLPDLPLHISISHTNGYVAVLLQDAEAAGIDIEHRTERVKKIRSRFMTIEEETNLDKQHETEHLLIHWCAKESLFKMINQTEVDFLEHLHIASFPFQEMGEIEAYETRTPKRERYNLFYRIYEDFVLVHSLCKEDR